MSSKNASSKKSPQEKTIESQPNGWAFLINLTNKTYNLVRVNNFLAACILAMCLVLIILALKFPGEKLPEAFQGFGGFLNNERFYFFPLCFLLFVSITGNIYQRKVYRNEIDRICSDRSKAIHAPGGIKDHTSSIEPDLGVA